MDTIRRGWLWRHHEEILAVALAYRWATLFVGLLMALLMPTSTGLMRFILLGTLGSAGIISVAIVRLSPSPWLPVLLALEIGVALLAVCLTDYYDSPLLLYVTAPLVHAALEREARLLAALGVLAVGLYTVMALLMTDEHPGPLILDAALIGLVPAMVLVTAHVAARQAQPAPLLPLDREDRSIAAKLVDGHTYKEIADALDLSPETVKVSVARIYRRLGTRSRDEAVRIIREFGLLDGVPASHASESRTDTTRRASSVRRSTPVRRSARAGD